MKKAETVCLNDLPAVKKAHKKAMDEGKDSFTTKLVDGEAVFDTKYAGYLIEHLSQFGVSEKK